MSESEVTYRIKMPATQNWLAGAAQAADQLLSHASHLAIVLNMASHRMSVSLDSQHRERMQRELALIDTLYADIRLELAPHMAKPDCPTCGGSGIVVVGDWLDNGRRNPAGDETRPCGCTQETEEEIP